jgi:hypothetical protein
MVTSLGALTGRRTAIDLAGGDCAARRAAGRQRSFALRRGERAVALEVASHRRPVCCARGAASMSWSSMVTDRVAARGLELLSPASERSGALQSRCARLC